MLSSLPIYSPSLALSIVRICSSRDGGFGLETACYYRYMGGQSRFCLSACDRRHDGGGAVLVASIILQNQNRTNAALLTAEAYAEVGGIDFASFNLFHS